MAKKTKDKKVVVEETPEIIPVETPWNNAFSPFEVAGTDPNALSNYPYSINVPPTVNSPTTNPIANGGTGAPAIQQAPIVSGTQQVIDLYNTMKSMPAVTDVTMQNSQLMNEEEIQATKDLNTKRQAEYDALVPTMIQSNKDSIQKYNDENQPKQTLPTPPPPPNGKPKTLADQYREMMTMEREDSSGSFIDNTGAVRSVATPTIISAPPPVMKDIPPAQYSTTTTSIRKPDPRTGTQGSRPKRQLPTISTMNWGTGVIEQASPNDVKEFTSDYRRSGQTFNNPSLAATLIERNYGGEPLPKGSTVKIPMIIYNKQTGQYENKGIQDISVEGQTMTDVISRVFNANLALNTLESLNKNKNNMADNYGQVDGSSLLKFNPHTFDQDRGGVYDTAYERAVSATNDAIGLKKGTTQLKGLLLQLKNTPNTALSESYLGAQDNNMLASYINGLAAINGQAIYGLLRRTR